MEKEQQEKKNDTQAAKPQQKSGGNAMNGNDSRRRGPRGGRGRRPQKPKSEFDQKIIDIARVTRVMKGGKRMSFRACVAVGDRKGKVGIGLAKGADVTNAISKAAAQAQKHLIEVRAVKGTIPHEVKAKFKAAHVYLKPGKKGGGVIAGGVVRMMLELAGIEDIVAKMYGSKNKVNNSKAVIEAFKSLRTQ